VSRISPQLLRTFRFRQAFLAPPELLLESRLQSQDYRVKTS